MTFVVRKSIDSRVSLLRDWLKEILSAETDLVPLPVEASTRRFFRVVTPTSSLIAMDSPPRTENNEQFVALSEVFRNQEIPVPQIIGVDLNQGFILVEDFGDRLFFDAYKTHPTMRDLCLKLAIDNLIRLQTVRSDHIDVYSVERFNTEIDIFNEWALRRLLKTSSRPLEKIQTSLVQATQDQPQTTIHRDYHSRNLLLRPNNQLGVIDFQDALVGPVSYDLASLIYDCYVDLPEKIVTKTIDTFCRENGSDDGEFTRSLELTAIQRSLKAVGLFIRLHLDQARNSHLIHIDRVLKRIAHLSNKHRELKAFSSWIGNDIRSQTNLAIRKNMS